MSAGSSSSASCASATRVRAASKLDRTPSKVASPSPSHRSAWRRSPPAMAILPRARWARPTAQVNPVWRLTSRPLVPSSCARTASPASRYASAHQARVAHPREKLDRLLEQRDRVLGVAVLQIRVAGPAEREGVVQRIRRQLDAAVPPVDRLLPGAARGREPRAVPRRVALEAMIGELLADREAAGGTRERGIQLTEEIPVDALPAQRLTEPPTLAGGL